VDRPVAPSTFYWQDISPKDIVDIVSKFSNSKSLDFYWLSNYIVKLTIEYIKEPFAFIINKCLQFGYFSDLLKISKIVPIYKKKGDKSDPKNYRPISIVPIFSKVIESVMHKQLYNYFEAYNLFSESQFGFRTGKSTTTAVMSIINEALQAFEEKQSVALTLFDLSKAFDCIPPKNISEKLKLYYGVAPEACEIIDSYFSRRRQYVVVDGVVSMVMYVTMGVGQGSKLGPFFFLVDINDLPKHVKHVDVDSVVYVDDSTFLKRNKNLIELNEMMEAAEANAFNWFSTNKLHCNQDKTQRILLSLSQNTQDSVKLLGFLIDSKLNWVDHVNAVCSKVSRVSFLLWKLRDIVSDEYLRMAYFGLFQSHISYGLILWGHSHAVSRLLLTQKKVIRTICRVSFFEHCKPLFKKCKILTVINLYIYHILLYTKANLSTFFVRQDFHEYNTRNSNRLDIPQHRLSKTSESYKINCITFFNKLPVTAQTVHFNKFKKQVYEWLIHNPYYSVKEFLSDEIHIKFD